MEIQKYSLQQQGYGAFNGGEIIENKPLGFPQDGGLRPYSNLFYWAHARGMTDSTIGLHPHQGFEIMSFVLDGHIKHYDTQLKDWKPLQAGDAQIIRAGSGISHSEFLAKGSAIFQIWFDPDLSRTLSQPASYDDYTHSEFPVEEVPGGTVKTYVGEGSPFRLDTPGVGIFQLSLARGSYERPIDANRIISAYVISGTARLNGDLCGQDDFIVIRDTASLEITEASGLTLFVISSPALPPYRTYAQLMRDRMRTS